MPLINPYNAKRNEQTTICHECGNSTLAHGRASWTDDGISFCPTCFPTSAEDRVTALKAEVKKLRTELRSIAEGNLGDSPGQANYARIRDVARAALSTPSKEG